PAPVTETAYDPVGNALSVEDPLGRVTTYAYDALDRRTAAYEVSVFEEDALESFDRVTAFVYDAAGNLVRQDHGGPRVNPHEVVTTHAYDRLGRRTETTRAAVPTASAPDALRVLTTTVYDAADHVIRTIDPRGNTTRSEYDALGRRTAVT